MFSTQKVGIGLTSAFSKMSIIIPCLVGVLFLGQDNDLIYKAIGIGLVIIASVLILYTKGNKFKAGYFLLPLLVFIMSGVTDSGMELSRRFVISDSSESPFFLFLLFFTAFFCSLIISFIERKRAGSKLYLNSAIFGTLLGIFNFLASSMLLFNVKLYGGTVVFPIVNGSVVLIITILGALLFKERLTKRQIVGVVVAILSVVLIASISVSA